MNFRKLEEDLIRDEGLSLTAYKCTSNRLTIGVGHLLPAHSTAREISLEAAGAYLASDIGTAVDIIIGVFGRKVFDSMSEPRQHALVNMAFNLGYSGFKGFRRMIAAIKSGDWNIAADEAMDSLWSQQVGPRAKRIALALMEGGTD